MHRRQSARSASLLWLVLLAAPAVKAQVTFNKDIAPLVYQHCASCHHAGGIGPFPLLTYSDVRKHASQIVAVTQRRYMPPWPPEPGHGDFADDRRLSDAQIRLIAEWVKDGAREGNPADRSVPPQFTSEWQLGPPDLIVRMRQPFTMPASGTDVFRNFIIPTHLETTKYVRAIELRLNNTRVVHHANIVLDRTESLRKHDGEDGHPGFPGMDVTTESAANDFDPDSHFLFWKPGTVLHPEPDAMSWRLDPGNDLVVNLHLQPTGKPESIQAEIGIYFAKSAPTLFPILVQLEDDGAIDIPPGSRNSFVTDKLTLPVDTELLAIYPHAHYLGKLIEAWATLPNGHREWLIRIPDWDINWQAVYEYKHPMELPKGTTVQMRVTYDNSASNPRNPNNPPVRVRTGNRSQDEMGHVWLQLLPKGAEATEAGSPAQDGRIQIEEAAMQRRLEKYPADFLAHYNLASILQLSGKFDQAIACYEDALKIEPGSATAHNGLASVLLVTDQLARAIGELREALRLDPTYLNARYNLARALAASGDLKGAAEEYSSFVKQEPSDAGAQAGLGTLYFKQQRFGDAVRCFREAARLEPKDADIQANLGTALALSGDLPDAIKAFEQALRIDPAHEAARANLARAKAQLAARQ